MSVDITFPGNLAQVTTAADLRAVVSSFIDNGDLYLVRDLQGIFAFVPSSVSVDDGVNVIRPNDRTPLQAGRWIRDVSGLAPGPAGPSNNTRLNLAALKAAAISDLTSLYDGSLWAWTTGDYTGKADNVNIVKADSTAITVGAWVRQVPYVASRALLAVSANPAAGETMMLTEAGREGNFVWKAGDFSAITAVDTQQGMYVPSTLAGFGNTVGCWVRMLPFVDLWFADWFGIPGDPASGNGGGTEVQCHLQMAAMVNLANQMKPSEIRFGQKVYTLGAAIPMWNFLVTLQGARGAQGSIIVKRYVEADNVRGVFSFNNFAPNIRDIDIRATSGSGGSGISCVLTVNSPVVGFPELYNVRVSGGDFFRYSRVIDGSSNTSSAAGYRNFTVTNCEFFGAAQATTLLASVQHLRETGTFNVTSGGSSGISIQSSGAANNPNDDCQIFGFVEGTTNLNYFSRSQFVTPQVGAINVDANTVTTQWTGQRVTGVVTSASSSFTTTWDGMVVARGGNSTTGWRKWGDGRIEQWGKGATVSGRVAGTWPIAFTSTEVKAKANAPDDGGTNVIVSTQCIVNSLTAYTLVAAAASYSGPGTLSGVGANVSFYAVGQ